MPKTILDEVREIKESIARENDYDTQRIAISTRQPWDPKKTYGVPGRIFATEAEMEQFVKEREEEYARRVD